MGQTSIPADPFATLHARGLLAAQAGDLHAALEMLDRALALNPHDAGAHINRGTVLKLLGRSRDALESFDRAIILQPHAEAWFNRAVVLKELGRTGEALESYDRAIALKPAYADALYNRGLVLQELGEPQAALRSFDAALAVGPAAANAYCARGLALHELGNLPEALRSYDRAIERDPGQAGAHTNRGNVLNALGRRDEALASYDAAIALDAHHAEAHYSRGVVLRAVGRIEDAVRSYDRAIAARPDYVEAHWNKSLALLLLGDYAAGWPLYEWRWRRREAAAHAREFAAPLWLGRESLHGKTILLYPEQGFGDAIQFARYATLAAQRGARVLMEAPRELLALLASLEGVHEWIPMGSPLPPIDFHCPLLSLPLAFGTRLDSIPARVPYLSSDPQRRSEWEARLGPRQRPRLGVAWCGRSTHVDDAERSIRLEDFVRVLVPDYELVSLQRDLRPGDAKILDATDGLRHFGDELRDYGDTAALCDLMDLVVSVDTSIAHLAGALGKQVWILVAKVPDWRWLLDREDNPWYPTAKVYRQPVAGDWTSVLQRVRANLVLAAREDATPGPSPHASTAR